MTRPAAIPPAPRVPSLQEAIAAGGRHEAIAIVRRCRPGTTRDGKPFFEVQLGDRSAQVPAKIWSDATAALEQAQQLKFGTTVRTVFTVDSWQGRPQLKIEYLRPANASDGVDQAALFGEGIELVADLLAPVLAFDIETVPLHNVRELPPTIAQAVAKHSERLEWEDSKTMSLSPMLGRVVSLALGDATRPAGEQEPTVLVVPPAGCDVARLPASIRPCDEAQLLQAFWALAAAAETIVTFNGRGFDVPFLIGRSLVHGVRVPVDLLADRYSLQHHCDLMRALTGGERAPGPLSLDLVCFGLGIASPKGEMDGSMVAGAYAAGEIEQIASYNAADVTATIAVYRRLRDLLPGMQQGV